MITSGTFSQELPNSKNTRIDFRNLTVEAGGGVKEIRVNGQQSGQFLALQLSKAQGISALQWRRKNFRCGHFLRECSVEVL